VPEPDTANVQPVAVPVFEKSSAVRPVTSSENVSVYSIDEAFVGDDWVVVNPATLGAVVSRVMVLDAVVADDGPVLPAVSVPPSAANRGMIVPSEHPDTRTVRVVPESEPGANEQPVAVPAFEKSPASTPVTPSENVKVNEIVAEFVGVEAAEVNDTTEGIAVS